MNDNRKKNKERQAHIARLLEKNERINVNQLFEILQVSKETIRRDLKKQGSSREYMEEQFYQRHPKE